MDEDYCFYGGVKTVGLDTGAGKTERSRDLTRKTAFRCSPCSTHRGHKLELEHDTLTPTPDPQGAPTGHYPQPHSSLNLTSSQLTISTFSPSDPLFLPSAMATEQFCLRWNDFHANITAAFSEIKEDEDFLDVTLVSTSGS